MIKKTKGLEMKKYLVEIDNGIKITAKEIKWLIVNNAYNKICRDCGIKLCSQCTLIKVKEVSE